MPSVPDQTSPHHHQQSLVTLDDLRHRYGADWEIIGRPGGLAIITAEHRSGDGHSIRYIVATSVAELAAKLETAGTVEP